MDARKSWSESLPDRGPFHKYTPIDIVYSLERAIRSVAIDPADASRCVLDAGAKIRCWIAALPNQGHPLDPYPDLSGTAYLWSALSLVSSAMGSDGADGTWNVLRRAEANLRAWWLEDCRGRSVYSAVGA